MPGFKAATIVYGLWFLAWIFFESTGVFFGPTGVLKQGLVPWYTLSEWVWADEQHFHPLVWVMLLGLPLLAGHFAHFTFTGVKRIVTSLIHTING